MVLVSNSTVQCSMDEGTRYFKNRTFTHLTPTYLYGMSGVVLNPPLMVRLNPIKKAYG